jgi:hypothetical protein
VLDAAIAQIEASATEHFGKVDGWTGQCDGFIKTAKDALERFKKSGQNGDMMTIEGGPGTIKAMSDIARKDSTEFGKSWFEYREWNPSVNGVDKTTAANFSKKRSETINLQKGYQAKIHKMELQIKEAEGILKAAKAVEGNQAADVEDDRKEAKALEASVGALLEEIKTGNKIGLQVLKKNCDTISKTSKQKAISKDLHNSMTGVFKNAVSCHKEMNNRAKTMDSLLKNGKTTLKDNLTDAAVKKSLDAVDKDVKEGQKLVQDAAKLIAQSTKDLAAIAKAAK